MRPTSATWGKSADLIFDELRELRTEFRELRADFNRFQDRMIQIGFGMIGVLMAQLVAALVALS
ncbi:MAG TPA: hypothetical protein VHF45_04870 [Thermoleophilaceae bacterium]|nr:hypothetical protein [Thermoleophilaceae bacterium]